MKEKKVKVLKRYSAFLISILIVFVTSIAGIVVYAEYTKSSRAKRVIASYGNVGSKFSSNKLLKYEYLEDALNKVIFLANNTESSVVERVTVCNYAQGDALNTYEENIKYILHARLVTISGNTKTPLSSASPSVLENIDDDLLVTIEYNGQTKTLNKSTTSGDFINSIMTAGTSQTDVCKLTFSKEFNVDTTKVALELYTELVSGDEYGPYSGIKNLSGIFTTEVGASSNMWEGYFNDSPAITDSNIKKPSALDGYNYLITGNGKGTIILSWNSNKLSLNMQNPLIELPEGTPSGPDENGIETYEFSVDSDVKSSYRLQFYKNSGLTDEDLDTWSAFKNLVQVEFTSTGA